MSHDLVSRFDLLSGYVSVLPALLHATLSDRVRLAGATLCIPGPFSVRASVVAGNVRMRALLTRLVRPGDTVIDVGANIGAIAVHAARRVGLRGRVLALEPALDNLAVLRENLALNHCQTVSVVAAAAGRRREVRAFYVRGDISAVNSLFRDSCYAEVTDVTCVDVIPLDDLVSESVAMVKLDVEGAELEVLQGMPRLLAQPGLALVVEWHPLLQRAAGVEADALPHWLLDGGFSVHAVGHLSAAPLTRHGIEPLLARLLRRGAPVELVARRAPLGAGEAIPC